MKRKPRKEFCVSDKILIALLLIVLLVQILSLVVLTKGKITITINANSSILWTAIGSIGTVLSIISGVISYALSNYRVKKQETLDKYIAFKKSVESEENRIHNYTKEKIDKIIDSHKNGNNKEWDKIRNYLMKIEQIAVGVNCGIYDLRVIDKMGGHFLYEQYILLEPIINYKRTKDNNDRIYEEFKNMVNKIVKMRNDDDMKEVS